jgi:two-component system chemotaxis sensor kinase CheA
MAEMDETIKEFLVESYENLDRIDSEFIQLEERPGDRELLASIFRTIHTIKGTCGFLGMQKLESVAHVGENLLSKLRDGKLTMDETISEALLGMVDAVREMLGHIEQEGSEGNGDYSALIAALTALNEGHRSTVAVKTQAASAPREDSEAARKESHVSDSNIRVDVQLLDKLMNLVGELVLARNQLLQHSGEDQDPMIAATTQRLDLVTTELQEGVMKTRMQPIGGIWSKFPRVVRDLAKLTQKEVALEMTGEHTELDRTIIEAIKDPLTHVIRNCVDHGIESPADRQSAGKPRQGTIRLCAYHEGGQVIIEIIDDGRGVHPEKVKAKALERGLITADQAARMSERELVNLIFLPGFSTAAAVSNLSGRGVGMDVVKTNVEKIGGTVDVQSTVGKGTTLKLKIPLTLAIIPGLIITTSGDRYAIPQVSLLELLRLEAEEAATKIESVRGVPVYRLRGRLLPLVHLGTELGTERGGIPKDKPASIVVLQAEGRPFGLVVDEINDAEEIVVKPLSKQLKNLEVYAGATIMGDGHVALILDVLGLAQHSRVLTEMKETHGAGARADDKSEAGDRSSLLLCRIGEGGRMAIPLSSVARLEEFAADKLEHAGGRETVQYRGRIMPLVRLSEAFGEAGSTSEGPVQVVVYGQGEHTLGVVVEQILDILEEHVALQKGVGRSGTLGAAILQGKVTELLDLESIAREYLPVGAGV